VSDELDGVAILIGVAQELRNVRKARDVLEA